MANTPLSNGYLWMTLIIPLKFYPASLVSHDGLARTFVLAQDSARDVHASFAIHRPKLINARREALTHHFALHPPIQITRQTRQEHGGSTPSTMDGIQHAHDFFGSF